LRLPATVGAVPVALDRLAVLTPAGVTTGRGRHPFADRTVVAYTYDMATEALHRRLSELGGRPRAAATAETAVRLARRLGCPAVLPRGLALAYAGTGERVTAAAVTGRLTLYMVTTRPTPPEFAPLATLLHTHLGLDGPLPPAAGKTG
jgi:hypothetical protein